MTDQSYERLLAAIFGKTFREVLREECPEFVEAEKPALAMLDSAIEKLDAKDLDIGLFLMSLEPPFQNCVPACGKLLEFTFHREHDNILQALERCAVAGMRVPIPPIRAMLTHDFADLIPEDVSAIRRRCAWLLFKIGTEEAIAVLEEFADCGDDIVEIEALERLEALGVDVSEMGTPSNSP